MCCFVSASRDLSDLGVAFRDLLTHTHTENRTAGKDEINAKASKHLWLRKHELPHTHTTGSVSEGAQEVKGETHTCTAAKFGVFENPQLGAQIRNPIKLMFGPNSGKIWLKFTSQMTVEALYPPALLTWVTHLAEDDVFVCFFSFLLHGFVFKLHGV